jgi:hypothetical protein
MVPEPGRYLHEIQDSAESRPHPFGKTCLYSERRVAAALSRAVTRAGRSAIRFAATSVTGIIHSSASGVTVPAVTPAWLANSYHAHQPPTTPSGAPTQRATAVTVLTCYNVIAFSYRRSMPRASARSTGS